MTKGGVVMARDQRLGNDDRRSLHCFAPVEMTKGRVVMARTRGYRSFSWKWSARGLVDILAASFP
jgi:hypothetical protein